jgi:putative hydrolase
MDNKVIAEKLREISALLQVQAANPFRVNAYRRAADTISGLKEPVTDLIAREGFSGLTDLPNVGVGIARSISEYVSTGRMSRLESLKTGHDPVELFEQIPGIGPLLAHRLIETLQIDTLEALELAAHNNRLAQVPGFSGKKIELVKLWLANVLGYRRTGATSRGTIEEPPVSLLLQVDVLYR